MSATIIPTKRWRRSTVSINKQALSHNLKKVREFAPRSQVMAVIKANAYGHGMKLAAQQLDDADLFAVVMPEEAYALRESGCTKPIVVLHGFHNIEELKAFSRLELSSVVHQQKQLELLLENDLSTAIDAWIKVDTGMHRLGISMQKVDDYFGRLRNCKNIRNVYLMSHFANADDISNKLNDLQLERFTQVSNDLEVDCSMANSAAIIKLPKAHFEIVRPGIMLYGSSPFKGISAAQLGLKAVMQFESMILDIKLIKAGESIGYGSRYHCEKDKRVAIVAAGYADGYPRHASNGAPVWLNNQRCELLGRVSMDSLCIDIDEIEADIGDRVVLWGEELSVDEVALASETIAYELLCNAGAAHISID